MRPLEFVQTLRALNFENTFNPYSDRCPVHDLDDAPSRRSEILQSILEEAVKLEIDSIWIGRDLGYRGGRRTGLALTDDLHIHHHAARWGLTVQRPTKGRAVVERTAAVIWNSLSQIDAPIFLWNVFPLHPHGFGEPFSNRSHNSRERKVGEDFLVKLIDLLQPLRIVAIGNDAARAAYRIGKQRDVSKVRHPSYGGQAQFLRQVQDLYS